MPSSEHVLSALSKALLLVWQDVLGNELWHLTCLTLTGWSQWGFRYLGQPCLTPPLASRGAEGAVSQLLRDSSQVGQHQHSHVPAQLPESLGKRSHGCPFDILHARSCLSAGMGQTSCPFFPPSKGRDQCQPLHTGHFCCRKVGRQWD